VLGAYSPCGVYDNDAAGVCSAYSPPDAGHLPRKRRPSRSVSGKCIARSEKGMRAAWQTETTELPVKILWPEIRLNHRTAVRIVTLPFPAARAPGRGNFARCGKASVVVIPDSMPNLPAYLAFAMTIKVLYAVVVVFRFSVHYHFLPFIFSSRS
jgi:hypothetical protein